MDVEPAVWNRHCLRMLMIAALVLAVGGGAWCQHACAEFPFFGENRDEGTVHSRWQEKKSGLSGLKELWSDYWEDRCECHRTTRRTLYERYHSHHHLLHPRHPVEWSSTYGYFETEWQRFPAQPNWCPPPAHVPYSYVQPTAPPPAPAAENGPGLPEQSPPDPDRSQEDYFPPANPAENPPVPPAAEPRPAPEPPDAARAPAGRQTLELILFETGPSSGSAPHSSGPVGVPPSTSARDGDELLNLTPLREPEELARFPLISRRVTTGRVVLPPTDDSSRPAPLQ